MHTLSHLPPEIEESFEQYMARFFERAVINGLLSHTLTPERAYILARQAHHYARRAQVQAAHKAVVQLGFNVIHASFGGGR